jgi:hypothetical protein
MSLRFLFLCSFFVLGQLSWLAAQEFRLALPESGLDPMTLVRSIKGSETGSSLEVVEYNMLKASVDGRRVNQYYRGSLVRIRNEARTHEIDFVDWNSSEHFLVVEVVIDDLKNIKFHRPGANDRWDWIVESFDSSKGSAQFDPSAQAQRPARDTVNSETADQRFARQIRYFTQAEKLLKKVYDFSRLQTGTPSERALLTLRFLKQETNQNPELASHIIQAWTLYGESRGDRNLAHRAAILSTMENRRLRPETLSVNLWPYLSPLSSWLKGRAGRSALLDEAFQVWNPENPNLNAMLQANIESDEAFTECLNVVAAYRAGRIVSSSPEALSSATTYDHTGDDGKTIFDDNSNYQRITTDFFVWMEDSPKLKQRFDHSFIRIYY